ncbi:MAG: DUF2855 family protein [Bacteroidota bacterium]
MPTQILVNKKNILSTKSRSVDSPPLAPGEARLKLLKYAMTTNNITYAVTGHRIGYWKFFPVDEEWGIVPVWGFAEVLESGHEGLEVGEKVYGYFPMAEELTVTVGKLGDYGFIDAADHRQALPPIYNYYNRLKADPTYIEAVEDYIPIIRPLFATSFLNYQFLKEESFFGVNQIIITSASSKTALGLAYLLHEHQGEHGKQIIGLTSDRNMDFVKGTGFYDTVTSYGQIGSELVDEDSLIVDMAGNGKLLQGIDKQLGEKLKFISMIGLTDWQTGVADLGLSQAKFFFAPTYAQKLFKEWGQVKANTAIAQNMGKFIEQAKNWIKIQHIEDYAELEKLYVNMAKGEVDPAIGYIVKS